MVSQFVDFGLEDYFMRISATDALQLSVDDNKNYKPGKWMCSRWELSHYHIAVFESHRRIWQYIVESNLSYGIILEDDVKLSYSLLNFISNISSTISSVDVIKLDGIGSRRRFGSPMSIRNMQIDIRPIVEQPLFSAGAYMVSHNGAKYLLKHSIQYSDGLDYYIFKPRKDYKLFQAFPALAIQGVLMQNHLKCKGDYIPTSGVPELGKYGKVNSKGPIIYRLLRELKRGLRRIRRYLLTDWLLIHKRNGYIGRVPLEVDLGEYI